jgi:hypothetical protein
MSGKDFRRSPQRLVEQISGGHHRDKWKIFQEVTTEINGRDLQMSQVR